MIVWEMVSVAVRPGERRITLTQLLLAIFNTASSASRPPEEPRFLVTLDCQNANFGLRRPISCVVVDSPGSDRSEIRLSVENDWVAHCPVRSSEIRKKRMSAAIIMRLTLDQIIKTHDSCI